MTTFFVDSSALVMRYISDGGSVWVISWIEPVAGNIAVISELATVEMFSSLSPRGREGSLLQTAVQALQNDFLLHLEKEYLVVPLDSAILVGSRVLVNKYPLRTLDAIQLACAVRAAAILNEPMTFVTADNNLLKVAAAEGFTIDNPNAHP